MSINRGKSKACVSEGLSPSQSTGACLSLTGRLRVSWNSCCFPSSCSMIQGWGVCSFFSFLFFFFLRSGSPTLTAAAHLSPPGPGRVGADHMFG